MNRVGAVRACPENAERLLAKESVVTVFPEGVYGIKKLFSERYRLQRFGRGGYIRLALRMRAPIVPCAIVGAEETNPLLYRLESMAELFGLPYIPITPTFPLLGPLGLVPAPTRWRIKFGEPIQVGSYGPEAADDQLLVSRLSDRVRNAIQGLLESGLARASQHMVRVSGPSGVLIVDKPTGKTSHDIVAQARRHFRHPRRRTRRDPRSAGERGALVALRRGDQALRLPHRGRQALSDARELRPFHRYARR